MVRKYGKDRLLENRKEYMIWRSFKLVCWMLLVTSLCSGLVGAVDFNNTGLLFWYNGTYESTMNETTTQYYEINFTNTTYWEIFNPPDANSTSPCSDCQLAIDGDYTTFANIVSSKTIYTNYSVSAEVVIGNITSQIYSDGTSGFEVSCYNSTGDWKSMGIIRSISETTNVSLTINPKCFYGNNVLMMKHDSVIVGGGVKLYDSYLDLFKTNPDDVYLEISGIGNITPNMSSISANTVNFTATVSFDLFENNNEIRENKWVFKTYNSTGDITYHKQTIENFNQTTLWSYIPDQILTTGNKIVGELVSLIFNYTNTSSLATISGLLEFNNTNYTGILSHPNIASNVYMPNVTYPSESLSLRGLLNVSYGDVWYIRNNTGTVDVFDFLINEDCATGVPFLTINTLDEVNSTSLNNVTVNVAFDIWKGDHIEEFNYNLTVDGTHNFCIDPDWATLNMNATFDYKLDDYDRRFYFIKNMEISNTPEVINMYSLESSIGDPLQVTVEDSSGITQQDILIRLQRYYPQTDSYITVAMGQTGGDGTFSFDVDLYDVLYRFVLLDSDGTLLKEDPASTIGASTWTLVTDTALSGKYWNYLDLTYSCSNTTTMITCSVTDTTGGMTSATLEVFDTSSTRFTQICSTTGTSSSVTLECNTTGYSSGLLRYNLISNIGGVNYLLISEYLDDTSPLVPTSTNGLFPTLILILVISAIGIRDPSIAIMLSIVAVVISFGIGLFDVGMGGLVGFVVAGAIFVYKSGS